MTSFHVQLVPPASLSLNRRSRSGYHEHADDTARYRQDAAHLLRAIYRPGEEGSITPPLPPVCITYEVVWPKGRRRIDCDALAGLCKPLQDALVDSMVIVSDGPDWLVETRYRQRRCGPNEEGGVTVTIEQMGEWTP